MALLGHLEYILEERFVSNLDSQRAIMTCIDMYISNAGSFCNIVSTDNWSRCHLQYVSYNFVCLLCVQYICGSHK